MAVTRSQESSRPEASRSAKRPTAGERLAAANDKVAERRVKMLNKRIAGLEKNLAEERARGAARDMSGGISDHDMIDVANAMERSQLREQPQHMERSQLGEQPQHSERDGIDGGEHSGGGTAITSTRRTYLNYKPEEYGELTAKGAWYDKDNQALYVPPSKDLTKFAEHIVPPEHAVTEAFHVNVTKAELDAKGIKLPYHPKPHWSYYIKPGSDERDHQALMAPFKEAKYRNEPTYLNITPKNGKQFWDEMKKDDKRLQKLIEKGADGRWAIRPARDVSQFGPYLANDKHSSNIDLVLDKDKIRSLSDDVLGQMNVKVVGTGAARVALLPRGADGADVKDLLKDPSQLGRGVHAPRNEDRERSIEQHHEVIAKVLEARPNDRSRAHAAAGR